MLQTKWKISYNNLNGMSSAAEHVWVTMEENMVTKGVKVELTHKIHTGMDTCNIDS